MITIAQAVKRRFHEMVVSGDIKNIHDQPAVVSSVNSAMSSTVEIDRLLFECTDIYAIENRVSNTNALDDDDASKLSESDLVILMSWALDSAINEAIEHQEKAFHEQENDMAIELGLINDFDRIFCFS